MSSVIYFNYIIVYIYSNIYIVIYVLQDDLKKGIKLDFKQLEAVKPCLDLLAAQEYLLYFPVWLNADILSGPVEGEYIILYYIV